MSVTLFAFALLAASPQIGAADAPAPELAVQPLAAGHADQALATLEQASAADPGDAAVLINLGIAYAQAGEDAKARAAFQQALTCDEVVELETADGSTTDSRRLARKAIRMLERGEFRTQTARADQLTLRD
ncbi:MAG: tetratricopeptide repeat protein [Erythrobacter sp.]